MSQERHIVERERVMPWTDAQVEAALWAFDNCQKGRVAAMRAALEAAAQAAPAPDADVRLAMRNVREAMDRAEPDGDKE
jgi:hypothetical protein